MRACSKCHLDFDESLLPPSRKANYDYRCSSCKNKYQREYKQKNKRQWADWRRSGDIRKRALQSMLYACRSRAKRNGLTCDLTFEDIECRTNDQCPILRTPYAFACEDRKRAPTIDRIDNTKGYTQDNIQIISLRANIMKNDATEDNLVAFANWVYHMYG